MFEVFARNLVPSRLSAFCLNTHDLSCSTGRPGRSQMRTAG